MSIPYLNPLRSITGLRAERIDQGVDFAGTGPIYSLGSGTVVQTVNAGWPGGAFICIRLSDGPWAGYYYYSAEDITPTVSVGQTVNEQTVIGHVFAGGSGIEMGWAAGPPNVGESLARLNGQIAPAGDAGAVSSAYGKNFSDLLHYLGAPAGILQGSVVGSLPSSWPSIGGTPMTRTMYDALLASGIPHGAQIACWYPHDPRSDGPPVGASLVLTIDNAGSHPDCNILDVESGAASFAAVPAWLDANKNRFPTIYCSQSNVGSVVSAAGSRHFYLWVAAWGTGPTQIFFPQFNTVTTVAHQYADVGPYDLSIVYNDTWYAATPPPPPPPPSAPVLGSVAEYQGETVRFSGGTSPWKVEVWTDPENKVVFNRVVSVTEVGVQPVVPGQLYAWQVTDANGHKSAIGTFTPH